MYGINHSAPLRRGFSMERGGMNLYRFMRNNRVIQPGDGVSRKEAMTLQARKIIEEANEVLAAVENDEGQTRILEECADVIQAVEGLQRMHDRQYVVSSFRRVRIKSRDRGDYEGNAKGYSLP